MALVVDRRPRKRDIIDRDEDGNEEIYHIWIREFSEADVKVRTQLLSAQVSEEDSRRGRSQRGKQQQQVHVERIRVFNFERGVKEWDFVFPDEYWDETEEVLKPHPKAGEPMPINREIFEIIPERIMDQIQDYINALNEPPDELPEVRDENGQVTQKEEHSPLEPSFAGRSEQL